MSRKTWNPFRASRTHTDFLKANNCTEKLSFLGKYSCRGVKDKYCPISITFMTPINIIFILIQNLTVIPVTCFLVY